MQNNIKQPTTIDDAYNVRGIRDEIMLERANVLRYPNHSRTFEIFLGRVRKLIADYKGVDNYFIESRWRKREYVEARFLFGWMIYKIYGNHMSLMAYGKLIGGRGHATWINAKKTYCGLMETDKEFMGVVNFLWEGTKDILYDVMERIMPYDKFNSNELMKPEKILHEMVVKYLKYQYPNMLFNTDLSGVFLPVGLATQMAKLRSHRGHPDLVIYEPRNGYHGLFLELKAEGVKVFTEEGLLVSDNHIKKQAEYIDKLKERGYQAAFACGFDEAIRIIDEYMS